MAYNELNSISHIFPPRCLFPLQSMPSWLGCIMYIDPLTYGMDELRGILIGVGTSAVPHWLDFVVLLILCMVLATLGSYFFSRMEVD